MFEFETKKTLIVVYKDELLMNQLKKMVETHDDDAQGIIGTRGEPFNKRSVWCAFGIKIGYYFQKWMQRFRCIHFFAMYGFGFAPGRAAQKTQTGHRNFSDSSTFAPARRIY